VGPDEGDAVVGETEGSNEVVGAGDAVGAAEGSNETVGGGDTGGAAIGEDEAKSVS